MKNDIRYYTKEFYSIEIIRKAIQAYKSLAVISVSEEESHYRCRFTGCVTDAERIAREFDNYLIELLNSAAASGNP